MTTKTFNARHGLSVGVGSISVVDANGNIIANTITIGSASLNSSSFSGTSNNALYLGGQLPAYYTNASNLSTGTINELRLPTSGVTSGTYGNSSQLPVITVDSYGRITNVVSTAVAGVSGFEYAAANVTFTITTSAGSSYTATIASANSSTKGVMYVVDSVSNTDTLVAASANSVKTAYDAAVSAYSNAIFFANSAANNAYTNAVSTAATDATNKAANAYSNATSYAATIAANAYSNAISYADVVANTAYTNAVSTAATDATNKAANAYSNAVSYANTAAGTAYSNATTFASNASNISSGTLSETILPYRMDQDVRTTDTVEFGNMTITGNLTVTGTTVTVNANNLTIQDNMIYLNDGSIVANPDLGIAGNYNDGTYRHAGFFRDATDGVWKVYDQYLPEPDASPYIDTSNASFRIADFQANVVTISSANVGGATINATNYSGTSNNTLYVGTVAAANVVSNTQLSSNLANYQTTAGLASNVATLTSNNATYAFGKTEGNLNVNSAQTALSANNADYLDGQHGAYYAANSQLANYALLSGATFSGATTFNANVTLGSANHLILSSTSGISANGTYGTAGQMLASNGTAVYWLTPQIGDITAVTAGSGLTGGGTSGDLTINVGAGTGITVNADDIAVNAAYIATISSNNASFLGGTAAASYQLNSTLAANVATMTANNTSFVGTVAAANVVSNTQLASNLANYQTTAGLSANVATLTSNNATYFGGYTWAAPGALGTVTANTGAFTTANAANVNITGTLNTLNAIISGNLTVSGTTTYVNTTQLNVGDNIITLNADITGATAPTENAGIEINRGSSANVQFLWDETNDRWSTNGQPLSVASLIAAGAVSGITTLAAGNITITGFANVSSTLQVGGQTTFNANVTLGAADHLILSSTSGISANGTYGSNGQVLTSNGTVAYWANSAAGGFTGKVVTSNTTIAKNESIVADSTSSTITVNLPSSATTGDIFIVHSLGGNTNIESSTLLIMDAGVGNGLLLEEGQSVWLQAVNSSAVDIVFALPGAGGGSVSSIAAGNGIATNTVGGDVTISVNSTYIATLTSNNANYLQTKTWEAPGSIGSTTANSGAFTTLFASANVNVDNGTLFVDAVNNRVGIGNTSPAGEALDVRGNIRVGGADAGPNYIAFRGTTGDGPGSYNHTYVGERIYSGTEASEMFVFKGNDQTASAPDGPDRIRMAAGEFRVDTYSTALSGDFNTVASNTTSLTNKFIVSGNGNVGIGNTTPTNLLSVGGTVSTSGILTSTAGANAISFTNATSNYLMWNTAGVAAPTLSTRSAGTKAVLYPAISAGAVDYALGVESSHMWFSAAGSDGGFKWYSATTNIMTANTTGLNLNTRALSGVTTAAVGNTTITGFANVSSTLQVTSNATFNSDVIISSAYPRIYLTDTNNNSDYSLINADGNFIIYDDTNAAERMRINTSGNMALGQTTAAARFTSATGTFGDASAASSNVPLYVKSFGGTVSNTRNLSVSHLYTNNTASYGNMQLLFLNANDSAAISGSIVYTSDGSIAFRNNGSAPSAETLTGSERMAIVANGNIGVGTSTPARTLHVRSTALVSTQLETTSASSYLDIVDVSSNYLRLGSFSGVTGIASGAGTTPHIAITGGGNVGIGTTSPQRPLHVYYGSSVTGAYTAILQGYVGGYGAGVSFQSQLTGGGVAEMARITADGEDAWNTTASTQDAGLRFYTSLDGAVAEKMRLNASGNLLVGYTTAYDKLQVAGSVSSQGGGYFGFYRNGPSNNITTLDGVTVAQFGVSAGVATGRSDASTWLSGFDSLRLVTAGAERMRLDTSGNVGIGTSSPLAKLNVEGGDVLLRGGKYVVGPTAGGNGAGAIRGSLNGVLGSLIFQTENASAALADVMTLDGYGNLGLGVVPSAWGSSFKAIDVGAAAFAATGNDSYQGANWFYSGAAYVYKNTGYATLYNQSSGAHSWYTAPSGTAGNAITFTQAMTLDASGNLGIGTSSPSAKVEAAGAGVLYSLKYTNDAASALIAWKNTSGTTLWDIGGGVATAQDELAFRRQGSTVMLLNSSGSVGIGTSSPGPIKALGDRVVQVMAPSGKNAMVLTSAATGGAALGLYSLDGSTESGLYSNANGPMLFWTNGTERMRIDSSGNVGIGTTTPGYKLEVNGSFAATTKSFIIDHPTKPGMKLRYGSLEGPENGVYVRGRLRVDNIIELPDYWTGLVDEDTITVNLTPIGKGQSLYVAYIGDGFIRVENGTTADIDCFYTVFAERKDVEKLVVEF